MTPNNPIGLFDSGIGGLTVFREVARLLPKETLLYFGDTARLPYGTKSPETITRCTLECASFLLKQNIKLLLIACHTASAHALSALQAALPIPVLGVVQPGFELLMRTTRTHRVALLGTSSTIGSAVYQTLSRTRAPSTEIYPIACPLFVPLAEEQLHLHPAAQSIADHYLAPLRKTNIDALLLACTHYPLLLPVIQQAVGPTVQILDASASSAQSAQALLQKRHLLGDNPAPLHRFYTTDNPSRFLALAKTFLGHSIQPDQLQLVSF